MACQGCRPAAWPHRYLPAGNYGQCSCRSTHWPSCGTVPRSIPGTIRKREDPEYRAAQYSEDTPPNRTEQRPDDQEPDPKGKRQASQEQSMCRPQPRAKPESPQRHAPQVEAEHPGCAHRSPPGLSVDDLVVFLPMFSSAPTRRERTPDIGGNRSSGRRYRSVSRAEPTSSRVARASGVLSWN